MSAILSRTNHGVSLDDLSAEWKRKNPDADQALRLGELDGRLAEVASSNREVLERLRRLKTRLSAPAREYLKKAEVNAQTWTKQQRRRSSENSSPPISP